MNALSATSTKTIGVKTPLSLLEKINDLDLEAIKFKLVFDAHGPHWDVEKVTQIEFLYKPFLVLIGKYPDRQIVPFSEDIDVFWHHHILDTLKYPKDCMDIFGRFIHYFPYLGLRGQEDAKFLQKSFDESCSLYEREFKIPLVRTSSLNIGCTNCAPVPSCSGEPNPTINQGRPSLKEYLGSVANH